MDLWKQITYFLGNEHQLRYVCNKIEKFTKSEIDLSNI